MPVGGSGFCQGLQEYRVCTFLTMFVCVSLAGGSKQAWLASGGRELLLCAARLESMAGPDEEALSHAVSLFCLPAQHQGGTDLSV